MAFVCIRRLFVCVLATLVLIPNTVYPCTGYEENVWFDGTWAILVLEQSGSQSRVTASVTVTALEGGASLEVWLDNAWVSGGVDTYATSSIRVSGGAATLEIAYPTCEEELVLQDD